MEQLVSSGLSIKDSLEVSLSINKKKKDDISSILLEKINKGVSFADAVNELDYVFPDTYRGIIKVGDRIGSVEKIFPRLRNYLESQKKIKDKFQGALIYPLLVLCTAFMAFIAMIVFVFPKLKTMFIEFGGEAAAQLEKNISKLKTSLIIVLLLIIIITILIVILKKISKGNTKLKLFIDRILLSVPVLKKIISSVQTLNFAFAMEILTGSGITIEKAISESLSVLTNEAYKNALLDINDRIIKGESLSSAFSKHNEFPDYINKWILVGEKSGKTDTVFSQIRNYFQNEVDILSSKFMSLIEPGLILLVGIFLIILILTIIVPVFSLYGSII